MIVIQQRVDSWVMPSGFMHSSQEGKLWHWEERFDRDRSGNPKGDRPDN